MDGGRINAALHRIDAALARLEASSRHPSAQSGDAETELAARHEQLRGAAVRALEALDAVIAEHET